MSELSRQRLPLRLTTCAELSGIQQANPQKTDFIELDVPGGGSRAAAQMLPETHVA